MQDVKVIEEQVEEEISEKQKRWIPRIFYIHLTLFFLLITGAFALFGVTGYFFYKSQIVLRVLQTKDLEYTADIYKVHLVGEMQLLQNEYDHLRKIVFFSLLIVLLYCVVAVTLIFFFHLFVSKKCAYYDETLFLRLRKEKRKKK